MLEIKTITENTQLRFDSAVNDAIAAGWELLRRECFITGADRATTFYAELERIIEEEPEEEEGVADLSSEWVVTRDPRNPYRCAACGHTTNAKWNLCPKCDRVMLK